MGRERFMALGIVRNRLPAEFRELRVRMLTRLVEARGLRDRGPKLVVTEGSQIGYVWVEGKDVDPILRRAAGQGRDSAAQLFGRAGPGIRYFRKARPDEAPDTSDRRDLRGFFDKGTSSIAVSIQLSVAEAREVAAHETRHWAGGDEPTARAFGERYLDAPIDVWSRR